MAAHFHRCCGLIALIALVAAGADAQHDLGRALAEIEDLARRHQYQKIVELLAPFAAEAATHEDPESAYAISAELGRAYFHLGSYQTAYEHFRTAVQINPQRVETALYLQASAYNIGRRKEALAIFREVVGSGAQDLYLAVTLPGERAFLSDPEVWQIIEEHARSISIDLHRLTFNGVGLGRHRSVVEGLFGATSGNAGGRTLAARAGPRPIWAFQFSANDQLEAVTIEAENVLRYTPYRISFSGTLDWRMTPAQAMSLLGAPIKTNSSSAGQIELSWISGQGLLTLSFGPPAPPRPALLPEGSAMLKMITVQQYD
jgi:tetratricopeptide (TPR) repeat protein